ncbi:MAG TPA: NfeD family protein [Bacilli bacterium]
MLQYVLIGLWAIVIILTIIIEFETSDLVSVWFTFGAIGALIAAALDVKPLYQLLIFAIVSIIFLLATRPFVKKLLSKGFVPTNADKLIGMVGIVTKDVTPYEVGEIKINNTLYRATNLENVSFSVGEKAIVKAISGTKLIISKLDENEYEKL